MLLVWIAVLAVVCAMCVKLPVHEQRGFREFTAFPGEFPRIISRPPTAVDIVQRLAIWGSASITATLGVLWIGRRVSQRRICAQPPAKCL